MFFLWQNGQSCYSSPLTIDDFTTAEQLPVEINSDSVSGSGILGGVRDVIFGVVGGGQTWSIGGGLMAENFPDINPGQYAEFELDYGGSFGNPRDLPLTDLSQGGTDNAIVFPITAISGTWSVNVQIDSGEYGSAGDTLSVSSPSDLTFPLSAFGDLATQADGVRIIFQSVGDPASMTVGGISVLATPEPSSVVLLGSALSLLAGFHLLRRRRVA
jgi:hypothetical protein